VNDIKAIGDVAMIEENGDAGRRKSACSDAANVRQWKPGDKREHLPLTLSAAHCPAASTSALVDDRYRRLDV